MKHDEATYRKFVRMIIKNRRVAFHPDNGFEEYTDMNDGSRTFTREEAQLYNKEMNGFFKNLGNLVYEIALEESRDVEKQLEIENRFIQGGHAFYALHTHVVELLAENNTKNDLLMGAFLAGINNIHKKMHELVPVGEEEKEDS